jgi:CRISPR-associated protein Cas2
MQCLLVYDIVDDGKRAKIAEVCLDYGLDRIQYSAFIGPLLPTHQDELMLKIKRVLGKRPGNIQLFPLCESDWDKRQLIVQKDGQKVAERSPAEEEDDDAG